MPRSVRMRPAWLVPAVVALRERWNGVGVAGLARGIFVPLLGLTVFLLIWHGAAGRIDTSLGQFPGPAQVWSQAANLYHEHQRERSRQAAFYDRQEQRNAERMARNPTAEVRVRAYTGKRTFLDQIGTSLIIVMSGFLLASVVAIPVGVVVGLSPTVHAALNPLIQIFKPVSPLAWLPLVTMIVSAVYVSRDPLLDKAFLNSMVTVTLCCLWPTIINTAVGVGGVSRDLNNVSRVLRLSWVTHVRKVVLPSSIPMMFTGLRVSLGIAWMVLIAAEMLAQSPGLGKFVWDEFQNGSSESLSRIMVAVLVIGAVGFLLDRGMLILQRRVSWDKSAVVR